MQYVALMHIDKCISRGNLLHQDNGVKGEDQLIKHVNIQWSSIKINNKSSWLIAPKADSYDNKLTNICMCETTRVDEQVKGQT